MSSKARDDVERELDRAVRGATAAYLVGWDLAGVDLDGLDFTCSDHGLRSATWDQSLPTDPATRELLAVLLRDWDGTLREAIAHTQAITPTDPESRRLLLTLLQDWEGAPEEAVTTAETVRTT